MQDDLPGMKPFEVDGRQQGIEEEGDHDDEGKGHAEVVQQLVCFVLLCISPNVEEKRRVSLPHLGG